MFFSIFLGLELGCFDFVVGAVFDTHIFNLLFKVCGEVRKMLLMRYCGNSGSVGRCSFRGEISQFISNEF